MTQLSGFWTTTGSPAGHQQASYTQAQWSSVMKIMAACAGFEGVALNYLNKLACTVPATNTVRVDTGGAVVDGKWYYNDATVDVNIPSAVGGGNTRIDRVVLRCGWAGFSCVITRIPGTDAVTPSAPAITQTPGTTYDITLYQALVNTSGTVTLTDERIWAAIDANGLLANAVITAKINDGAITSAKIGANAVVAGKLADGGVDTTARLANDIVDDTKVGNRVAQFYRRQGGSASNWSTPGSTSQTPTTVRTQAGVVAISGNTGVTFPVAFSDVPIIVATFYHVSSAGFAFLTARSATGFNVNAKDANGNDVNGDVHWIAFGPE